MIALKDNQTSIIFFKYTNLRNMEKRYVVFADCDRFEV